MLVCNVLSHLCVCMSLFGTSLWSSLCCWGVGGWGYQASFRKKKKDLVVTLYAVGGEIPEGNDNDSSDTSVLPGPGQLLRAKDSLEDMSKIDKALPPVPPGGGGKKGKKAKGKGGGGNGGATAAAASSGSGDSAADALKNKGNELLASGHLDEAVEAYSAALELVDDNAIFYANR